MILPPPINNVEPIYSYEEWRESGYTVLKGEKSCGRTTSGLPGFSASQVKGVPRVQERQQLNQEQVSRQPHMNDYAPNGHTNINSDVGIYSQRRAFTNPAGAYNYHVPQHHVTVEQVDALTAAETDVGLIVHINNYLREYHAPTEKTKPQKLIAEQQEEHVINNKRKIDI